MCWSTTIGFFIRHPMLDVVHYGPLVDYIQHLKYDHNEVFVRPGVTRIEPPPRPGFSMSGRTPGTLLRQMEAWHRRLGKETRGGDFKWNPCGLHGLDFAEGRIGQGSYKRWTTTELVSSQALVAESRVMKHCVSSYAGSCVAGRCSIWSLEMDSGDGPVRQLTLEVSTASKSLVQARGRSNRFSTERERQVLTRWAQNEGLSLTAW